MTIQKDPLNQSYKKAELLDPTAKPYQDNKYWLRPGETPDQYKQRTQPVSLDSTEVPMPPTFEEKPLTDNTSLQAQTERMRLDMEKEWQSRIDEWKAEREKQEKIEQEQAKKQEGILEQLDTQTQPFKEKMERDERARMGIDEEISSQRTLLNELDSLLTESNSLVRQISQQKVPGLAGLQQSERMMRTKETVEGRVAVIQAVMSARNNYIGQAYESIDRMKNDIQDDRKARIDYLNKVYDYYQETKDDAGTKIFNLSKQEEAMINKQIGLLEADYERAEATAQKIKDLILENPQMVAESGISLNDTEEEISKKLSDWQYVTELRDLKNEMQKDGIKEVSMPNDNTFEYTDSRGKVRYFQVPKEEMAFKDYPAEYKNWVLAGSPGKFEDFLSGEGIVKPTGFSEALSFALQQTGSPEQAAQDVFDKFGETYKLNYQDLLREAQSIANGIIENPEEMSGDWELPGEGGVEVEQMSELQKEIKRLQDLNKEMGVPRDAGLKQDLLKQGFNSKEIDRELSPFLTKITDLGTTIKNLFSGK